MTKRLANGVEIEENTSPGGRTWTIEALAPHRKVFKATGTHAVTITLFNRLGGRPDARKSINEDIQAGFEDCTQTDCDVCE